MKKNNSKRFALKIRVVLLGATLVLSSLLLSGCYEKNESQESVLRSAEQYNIKGPEERNQDQGVSANKLTVQTPGGGSQQSAEPAPQLENPSNSNSNSKQPPAMQINQAKIYSAVLKTTEGEIVIDLDAEKTPVTVNNFVSLARDNFYNGTIFHRVMKGFMIQGGDPKGDGTGGPGYKFDDEPIDGNYTRGTVAMANSGPNTNGSQFFIMHKDYDLPKSYVIFGHVSKGMDTVDKIAEAEVTVSSSGENSKPANPVKVESVNITEK
ncbi:MAG: peptidylprolyl isomerase [Parcubacteria group bacterium]|jgi:cyclophilin family peptidyl-prolyl cis-trans isomerase